MHNFVPTFEDYTYSINELSANSTLYHRSMHKFKVGDKITSQKTKKGTHWLENEPMEIGLEYFRKKNYPKLPSRFDCVYLSILPRSRFTDKGYLYVVKPVGKMFMTNSLLIDELGRSFTSSTSDRSLSDMSFFQKLKKNPEEAEYYISYFDADKYWKGVKSLPRENLGDIEVLADAAIVTEVIEDPDYVLRPGMDVTVTEDKKVNVNFAIYNSKDKEAILPDKEIKKLLKYIETKIIDGKFKSKGYDKNVYDASGFLRKGAKLKVTYVRTNNAKNAYYGDDKPKGRYNNIMFDFYVGKKLWRRQDDNPSFRFESASYANKNVMDIGQYLKK